MRLRPTDRHVYAFTQRERDTLVLALRNLIEERQDRGGRDVHGESAARIVDRIVAEESS